MNWEHDFPLRLNEQDDLILEDNPDAGLDVQVRADETLVMLEWERPDLDNNPWVAVEVYGGVIRVLVNRGQEETDDPINVTEV